ncbi:hypothetical protein I5677_16120 [Mobilitalea sibirica]|uniref:Uncharacterized protein n=1 Tax=Mobilitalea sibirica TaxID=1462919 RepID=A0A8J7L3E6_9FIRM|nr:hypothetical protein [Mobilitalea sibirica]MBH1942428.1 hypothetical protein [Mobilitalea sibirica]
MINPISYNNNHSIYNNPGAYNPKPSLDAINKIQGIYKVSDKEKNSIEKTASSECQTCKSRKYVDGSNESNVSFKSPTHISPGASFSMVRAHEQEHVSNAIRKGNQPGAQLISASVSLKMDVCPECGSSYISGGETRTQIKYDVNNPYGMERKKADESLLKGLFVNFVA